ncbi:hypothetical protein R6Q59_034512 [Mikania micrantha]
MKDLQKDSNYKNIPNKRNGRFICIQYYRTRRRIKSESFNSPDLSFFDRCNNHVTLNHEARVGDVMFSDRLANNLESISTTYLVNKSADRCHESGQSNYIDNSMREDGLYKLAENTCCLLRDNLIDFFDPGNKMEDDTRMHRDDSENSSAVTEVEYASFPGSLLSFSKKDYIPCILNTEDTIDDISNSPLLDSPESVLEDSSFDGDHQDVCHWEVDVESSLMSHIDSVQLSGGKLFCILNTEDPEIPCNDIIFMPTHPSPCVTPQTATDSIDPASSFTQSQMDGPDLSSEFDSAHPLVGDASKDVSMDHNPSISDPNNSDGEMDLPCFPDIEALILKLDFEYAQESWITNEVKRRKYIHSKRTIDRLEQSSSQRAMSSLGAFAVFYSHHFNYYIKKTEVTIGRSTDDTEVDIDLRKESHANMISRQQAAIKMENDGTFTLKNIGKSSILVKGKSISHGQVTALASSCLIQIRGMDFMFEINDRHVRWYMENIIKKTQGKFKTFEWSVTSG